jgi:hypothetical protein
MPIRRKGTGQFREGKWDRLCARLAEYPTEAIDFATLAVLRKDGSQRRHSHAILVFAEPVRGPMLLGADATVGYGVCRPINPGDNYA